MKKILAMVLTLCLLCGGVALADTTINQDSTSNTADTTVSYNVATCEDYTVTIPSSVSLTAGEGSELTGSMTLSLDASDFNVYGKHINVKLTDTANDFNLVNDEQKISYALKRMGSSDEITKGSLVLDWALSSGLLFNVYTVSAQYEISAEIPAHAPAGAYTDTLTFTVSVD